MRVFGHYVMGFLFFHQRIHSSVSVVFFHFISLLHHSCAQTCTKSNKLNITKLYLTIKKLITLCLTKEIGSRNNHVMPAITTRMTSVLTTGMIYVLTTRIVRAMTIMMVPVMTTGILHDIVMVTAHDISTIMIPAISSHGTYKKPH